VSEELHPKRYEVHILGCGCKLLFGYGEFLTPEDHLKFCSLHGAAEEAVRFLEEIVEDTSIHIGSGNKARARALILKARGK